MQEDVLKTKLHASLHEIGLLKVELEELKNKKKCFCESHSASTHKGAADFELLKLRYNNAELKRTIQRLEIGYGNGSKESMAKLRQQKEFSSEIMSLGGKLRRDAGAIHHNLSGFLSCMSEIFASQSYSQNRGILQIVHEMEKCIEALHNSISAYDAGFRRVSIKEKLQQSSPDSTDNSLNTGPMTRSSSAHYPSTVVHSSPRAHASSLHGNLQDTSRLQKLSISTEIDLLRKELRDFMAQTTKNLHQLPSDREICAQSSSSSSSTYYFLPTGPNAVHPPSTPKSTAAIPSTHLSSTRSKSAALTLTPRQQKVQQLLNKLGNAHIAPHSISFASTSPATPTFLATPPPQSVSMPPPVPHPAPVSGVAQTSTSRMSLRSPSKSHLQSRSKSSLPPSSRDRSLQYAQDLKTRRTSVSNQHSSPYQHSPTASPNATLSATTHSSSPRPIHTLRRKSLLNNSTDNPSGFAILPTPPSTPQGSSTSPKSHLPIESPIELPLPPTSHSSFAIPFDTDPSIHPVIQSENISAPPPSKYQDQVLSTLSRTCATLMRENQRLAAANSALHKDIQEREVRIQALQATADLVPEQRVSAEFLQSTVSCLETELHCERTSAQQLRHMLQAASQRIELLSSQRDSSFLQAETLRNQTLQADKLLREAIFLSPSSVAPVPISAAVTTATTNELSSDRATTGKGDLQSTTSDASSSEEHADDRQLAIGEGKGGDSVVSLLQTFLAERKIKQQIKQREREERRRKKHEPRKGGDKDNKAVLLSRSRTQARGVSSRSLLSYARGSTPSPRTTSFTTNSTTLKGLSHAPDTTPQQKSKVGVFNAQSLITPQEQGPSTRPQPQRLRAAPDSGVAENVPGTWDDIPTESIASDTATTTDVSAQYTTLESLQAVFREKQEANKTSMAQEVENEPFPSPKRPLDQLHDESVVPFSDTTSSSFSEDSGDATMTSRAPSIASFDSTDARLPMNVPDTVVRTFASWYLHTKNQPHSQFSQHSAAKKQRQTISLTSSSQPPATASSNPDHPSEDARSIVSVADSFVSPPSDASEISYRLSPSPAWAPQPAKRSLSLSLQRLRERNASTFASYASASATNSSFASPSQRKPDRKLVLHRDGSTSIRSVDSNSVSPNIRSPIGGIHVRESLPQRSASTPSSRSFSTPSTASSISLISRIVKDVRQTLRHTAHSATLPLDASTSTSPAAAPISASSSAPSQMAFSPDSVNTAMQSVGATLSPGGTLLSPDISVPAVTPTTEDIRKKALQRARRRLPSMSESAAASNTHSPLVPFRLRANSPKAKEGSMAVQPKSERTEASEFLLPPRTFSVNPSGEFSRPFSIRDTPGVESSSLEAAENMPSAPQPSVTTRKVVNVQLETSLDKSASRRSSITSTRSVPSTWSYDERSEASSFLDFVETGVLPAEWESSFHEQSDGDDGYMLSKENRSNTSLEVEEAIQFAFSGAANPALFGTSVALQELRVDVHSVDRPGADNEAMGVPKTPLVASEQDKDSEQIRGILEETSHATKAAERPVDRMHDLSEVASLDGSSSTGHSTHSLTSMLQLRPILHWKNGRT